MVAENFSHALKSPQPGTNLGESDLAEAVRLEGISSNSAFSTSPQKAISPQNIQGPVPCGSGTCRPQKYVSPVSEFTRKAKKLCEAYRWAYGMNAKLNCCLDCKREKCLVEGY